MPIKKEHDEEMDRVFKVGKTWVDKGKKLHPDFPIPPVGLPEPGKEHPPKERDPILDWQCGYFGTLTRNCSLRRGGCGFVFPKREIYDKDYCPWCGKDRYCRNRRVKEGNTCVMHGGRRTLAHKSINTADIRTRHGLTAKTPNDRLQLVLPPNLVEGYLAAKHDPELLKLTKIIAVTDARLEELYRRSETYDTEATWQALEAELKKLYDYQSRINSTFQSFLQASGQKDVDLMRRYLDQLGQQIREQFLDGMAAVIKSGRSDWDNWTDIQRTVEQRRKLTESQVNQLGKLHQIITVEQLLQKTEEFYTAITEVIRDPDILKKIGIALRRRVSDMGAIVELPDGEKYFKKSVYSVANYEATQLLADNNRDEDTADE